MVASIRQKDADKLEAFLDDISIAAEKAKDKVLRAGGKKAKEAVIRYAPRDTNVSLSGKRRNEGRVRLADDVSARLVYDSKFGGKRMLVGGGKKTGTIWHLVNDGGYKNRKPTHFVDKAASDLDGVLDQFIDEALKEGFS